MTIKQNLINRVLTEAGKQIAALDAAAATLDAAEFLCDRLNRTSEARAFCFQVLATAHPDSVSIAIANFQPITTQEALDALAAVGVSATAAEPSIEGYANPSSAALDLAGYDFQAIVSSPIGALLEAA